MASTSPCRSSAVAGQGGQVPADGRAAVRRRRPPWPAPLTRTTAPMRRAAARGAGELVVVEPGLPAMRLEQLGELALRCGVMTASCMPPRLDQAREPRRHRLRSSSKAASASSTIVRCFGRPGQRRRDQLAQGRAHACAGAERAIAGASFVGKQRLEFAGVRDRERPSRQVEMRGIDRDRVGRAGPC